MDSSQPFFGRKDELAALHNALDDPAGKAILVVGPAGMGKSMLVDHFIAAARNNTGLQCGVVREEVTPSNTVDSVLSIFMDRAYEAANITEGSFESTPRRLEQWRSVLNVLNIGDLVLSLKRDPLRNARDQFIAMIERIAGRLPANGRAVFVIEPEKYLPNDSDQDWAIVIRQLPERITLVFAQRPEDALADSVVVGELSNIISIPEGGLDVLDERGFNELVEARADDTGLSPEELMQVLDRYHRHPYAVAAAVNLLASGVAAEDLPKNPEPTKFAEAQWKQIRRGGRLARNSDQAIRLFEAYAILEVPVSDRVVETVSKLNREQRMALLADPFLGSLLREEAGLCRIYHAILRDTIRGQLDVETAREYHQRAADEYRAMLAKAETEQTAPDPAACTRAYRHVWEAEGIEKAVVVFVNECTPPLLHLGLLDEVEQTANGFLEYAGKDTETEANLRGNLGIVLRTRGDLNGAETMCRRSLAINKQLDRLEGMASDYGNLGNVKLTREDLDEAEEMHRQALAINKQLGRLEGMAINYTNLGIVMLARDELDGAEAMYCKALEIDEKLGSLEGKAIQYGNLGLVMERRGDLNGAEAMYSQALEINEPLGRLEGMAINYTNLGLVMKQLGEPARAREYWTKARDLFDQLGARHKAERVQGWLDNLPE